VRQTTKCPPVGFLLGQFSSVSPLVFLNYGNFPEVFLHFIYVFFVLPFFRLAHRFVYLAIRTNVSGSETGLGIRCSTERFCKLWIIFQTFIVRFTIYIKSFLSKQVPYALSKNYFYIEKISYRLFYLLHWFYSIVTHRGSAWFSRKNQFSCSQINLPHKCLDFRFQFL